jgi:hypothetical protein
LYPIKLFWYPRKRAVPKEITTVFKEITTVFEKIAAVPEKTR